MTDPEEILEPLWDKGIENPHPAWVCHDIPVEQLKEELLELLKRVNKPLMPWQAAYRLCVHWDLVALAALELAEERKIVIDRDEKHWVWLKTAEKKDG